MGKKKDKVKEKPVEEGKKLTLNNQCVKMYEKKAGWPKNFMEGDIKNMSMYLSLKYKLELKKDLNDDEKTAYDNLKVYKQYVNNAVFKEVLNWAAMQKAEKLAAKAEIKKAKKAKKNKSSEDQEYVAYKNPGILERAKNAVLDKMLDFSIWVNDKLIDMGV